MPDDAKHDEPALGHWDLAFRPVLAFIYLAAMAKRATSIAMTPPVENKTTITTEPKEDH